MLPQTLTYASEPLSPSLDFYFSLSDLLELRLALNFLSQVRLVSCRQPALNT